MALLESFGYKCMIFQSMSQKSMFYYLYFLYLYYHIFNSLSLLFCHYGCDSYLYLFTMHSNGTQLHKNVCFQLFLFFNCKLRLMKMVTAKIDVLTMTILTEHVGTHRPKFKIKHKIFCGSVRIKTIRMYVKYIFLYLTQIWKIVQTSGIFTNMCYKLIQFQTKTSSL